MRRRQDLDEILERWPFNPYQVNGRLIRAAGRQVLQLRVDLGVLQLEVEGRPDGQQPHGHATYLDHLVSLRQRLGPDLVLDEEQCMEVDREFVQFYHRRICWLHLKYFDRAIQDAEHTLRLMDICKEHSPNNQWTLSHEQYRPYVLYHLTQASALNCLRRKHGAEMAIEAINVGLDRMRNVFAEFEAELQFDDDELVQHLQELRDVLRKRYSVDRTLKEQLNDAIEQERYELAARLRDELARRRHDQPG